MQYTLMDISTSTTSTNGCKKRRKSLWGGSHNYKHSIQFCYFIQSDKSLAWWAIYHYCTWTMKVACVSLVINKPFLGMTYNMDVQFCWTDLQENNLHGSHITTSQYVCSPAVAHSSRFHVHVHFIHGHPVSCCWTVWDMKLTWMQLCIYNIKVSVASHITAEELPVLS